MQLIFKILALTILAFFTLLMVNITIPYFAFEDSIAFLRVKRWIIQNEIWKTSFYVHVITSCFCLTAGFTQFSRGILKNLPSLHRTVGVLYVVIILLFSGPSGLVMSLYANGGILSQIAFTLLSILWITFTFCAFYFAKKGDYEKHKQFMIRSYALTLSALTLRAWKFIIVLALRPHPMDVYMVVAWLGWLPNIIFAEWYIRQKLMPKKIAT